MLTAAAALLPPTGDAVKSEERAQHRVAGHRVGARRNGGLGERDEHQVQGRQVDRVDDCQVDRVDQDGQIGGAVCGWLDEIVGACARVADQRISLAVGCDELEASVGQGARAAARSVERSSASLT